MKTIIKLFLITHHLPVRIQTEDAMVYYRAMARLHGFSLVRARNFWTFV